MILPLAFEQTLIKLIEIAVHGAKTGLVKKIGWQVKNWAGDKNNPIAYICRKAWDKMRWFVESAIK